MHLRSAGIGTIPQRQRNAGEHEGKTRESSSTAGDFGGGGGTASRGGSSTRKKLIIWSLVLLQIFFVGYFWLFQLESIVRTDVGGAAIKGDADETDTIHNVNFITKSTLKTTITNRETTLQGTEKKLARMRRDFVLNENRLINETGTVLADEEAPMWCYLEGTLNTTLENRINAVVETEALAWLDTTCRCRADWHGKDCGQPEIIWRTLLTSKLTTMKLQEPMTKTPHRLVYMLNGNMLALELLELQLKNVDEVVDYFVINVSYRKTQRTQLKTLERRLKELLKPEQYLINYCASKRNNKIDVAKQGYSLYKANIAQGKIETTKATDLFLYTTNDEIINSKALKFLKYYYNADEESPRHIMRFRLKHVMYGFYWQHPSKTQISGVLCTFGTLNKLALGNPRMLLKKNVRAAEIVIGDLNHFGGWFCQFCQQPEEIIAELQLLADAAVAIPQTAKSPQIDVSYVQQQIAKGQDLDNKLTLLKLRRYAEKYYAPSYAEQYSWKFGNLLMNLYVTLEADDDDDAGEY